MKATLTAVQLEKAIENAKYREFEAAQRAARETAPHLVAMFTRNAAEARNDVQAYEVQLTALTAKANAPAKPRCAHYKAIRRFYAVAKAANLNCDNRKGMRAAFSALLGRTITTRADLQAADWGRAISGIEAGLVWW